MPSSSEERYRLHEIDRHPLARRRLAEELDQQAPKADDWW